MKETKPDISIITINYNGFKDTCELIDSLLSTVKKVTYEVIIVDNDSDKNEAQQLKDKYPSARIVANNTNTGFSGGNNIGIQQAQGKYILLLNNDTLIENDNLHYLIERIENNPFIGVVSPKIKFANPPDTIQFAGYTPLSTITLRNNLIGINEKDHGQYENAIPTPYAHGAAMMIKKEVIEKVGLMPEIYFLYYEELDWCTQISQAGYELWYEPKCTVIHKESQSVGAKSSLQFFYMARNRSLYAWRNRKGYAKWAAIFYQLGIVTPKNCLINIFKLKFDLVKAILKGNIAFIRLKHKML